jgi:hypothetical protein
MCHSARIFFESKASAQLKKDSGGMTKRRLACNPGHIPKSGEIHMSLLQSNQARYFFETAALSSDTLQVVDFSGREAISQLFRFDLNLVSDDPEINFADVIKKPATLTRRRAREFSPARRRFRAIGTAIICSRRFRALARRGRLSPYGWAKPARRYTAISEAKTKQKIKGGR